MKWLVTLVLVAACGGPARHEVAIRDLMFLPNELRVGVGDTVVWTNYDIVPHTVTFADRDGPDEVPSGGTWETVVTNDTLEYRCRYHPSMTGRLLFR